FRRACLSRRTDSLSHVAIVLDADILELPVVALADFFDDELALGNVGKPADPLAVMQCLVLLPVEIDCQFHGVREPDRGCCLPPLLCCEKRDDFSSVAAPVTQREQFFTLQFTTFIERLLEACCDPCRKRRC